MTATQPKTRTIYGAVPIDIEALLVWTYRDQKADRVIGMGMGMFDQEAAMDDREVYRTSADGVATIARIGLLGTRVDGGGASAAHLHADAETVHTAVEALDLDVAMVVQKHARAASRPDHDAIVLPKACPVPNRLGRPTVRYEVWDKGRDYGTCAVYWTTSPVSADVIRIEYAIWRNALKLLAITLAIGGRLTDHRPMMPAAPEVATLRCA